MGRAENPGGEGKPGSPHEHDCELSASSARGWQAASCTCTGYGCSGLSLWDLEVILPLISIKPGFALHLHFTRY